jgi:beta-galactosidase
MAHYAFSDAAGNNIANWRAGLTFHPSGAIDVDNSLERADGLPVMPRLGMNVELIRRLDDVEWLGRGPFENYSDRNTAASVGRYSNTVADHYVPYMRPQENGYKTDVRWLSLADNGNVGLLISTDSRFSFGVHHNRLQDFVPPVKIAITSEDGPGARDNEERVNIHVNDIVPRDLVASTSTTDRWAWVATTPEANARCRNTRSTKNNTNTGLRYSGTRPEMAGWTNWSTAASDKPRT